MDDLDLVQSRRKKTELLDSRLGFETRNEDPQKHQQQGQGKIPGIILKGVVVALAVALLPLLQKQSNISNHATVARSWELINLLLVGLAVPYGIMARRPDKVKDTNDDNDDGQGAGNYVQKMFEFARVFDDFKPEGVRDKVEIWSSRWQPEESVVVVAGNHNHDKKEKGEKPLLLPVRSLKSSLSDPDVLDFLEDGKIVADSKPVQERKKEVRNGELFTVESGNFEEEMDHFMSGNGQPAVFPSPIPWASRRDVSNGGKEPHQPAPDADILVPMEGKIEHVNKLPAIPSPIPWHSRPDRPSNDGKQNNTSENPNVSEGKPPLAPPQRPSVSPSPSPSLRPSPSPPRPRSAGLSNDGSYRNVQNPPRTPPQKLSSPRPSPSPPRPRSGNVENGSSQKQTHPKAPTTTQTSAKETPPPPPPAPSVIENGLRAKNGSSQSNNANGEVLRHRESKDVPNSASSDEVKPRKAPIGSPVPSTTPLSPAHSAVFEESPVPRKASENGVAYRSDSRSKGREGSSHRSDSRSKSRDVSSHSQHSSRQVENDSSVLKQKMKDTDIPPRMQSEKSSRKVPSPPPRPPVYDHVPFSDPLPPPPPPPMYPDEPTSDPMTSPLSVSKDEEHTASFSDDVKHEVKTSSPSKVVFELGTSDSEPESELELDNSGDEFADGPDEVDKKAAQFIANFHKQIRLQRQESIRRSQKAALKERS